MIDKKYYDENKILNELYFKTFTKDGIHHNPNYNPNKPTYKFNDKEIDQLTDEIKLYNSQNYFEFSISLVVEFMEYYNIKSTKELYDLIRPMEVENVT